MSEIADENKRAEPSNRWILTTYRSLSQRGFLILMGLLALVSFVAGVFFLVIGAWPVFGFFGVDVLLIYIAFKLNYRSGKIYETVELDPSMLTLTRVYPSGKAERYEFNPYWVRVKLTERVDGRTALSLTSHGEVFPFARFLTDDERRDFAGELSQALSTARVSRI